MPVLKNPKWERFAQELAKGCTNTEAYEAAGYESAGVTASAAATRLLKNVKIQARVSELQERGAKRAEVTIEQIATQLDEDRELARSVKQAGAAVSASLGKAKLFGLIREKHEHSGPNGGPIKHDLSFLSDEKLAQLEAILGSNPNARGGQGGDQTEGGKA